LAAPLKNVRRLFEASLLLLLLLLAFVAVPA
jgi:hypothetical protein